MREIKYEIQDIFEVDGSLRDVIVENTNIEDWNRIFSYFKSSQFKSTLKIDGNKILFDNITIDEIFEKTEKQNVLLEVMVGKVKVNCYFFCEDEIELDIDPKEVANNKVAQEIFEFLEGLSIELDKVVLLTPEGMGKACLARFSPVV